MLKESCNVWHSGLTVQKKWSCQGSEGSPQNNCKGKVANTWNHPQYIGLGNITRNKESFKYRSF